MPGLMEVVMIEPGATKITIGLAGAFKVTCFVEPIHYDPATGLITLDNIHNPKDCVFQLLQRFNLSWVVFSWYPTTDNVTAITSADTTFTFVPCVVRPPQHTVVEGSSAKYTEVALVALGPSTFNLKFVFFTGKAATCTSVSYKFDTTSGAMVVDQGALEGCIEATMNSFGDKWIALSWDPVGKAAGLTLQSGTILLS
jgi:hypothetical protein